MKLFIFLSVSVLMLAQLANGEVLEENKDSVRESISKRQRTEWMTFFLDESGKAVLPQTTIAVDFFNRAVEHFEKKEYDLAQEMLQESISYDDKNPLAYELLGDIEYVQHRLLPAKELYKKAYLLAPSEILKEKIEKVSRETPLEPEFLTQETEHFTLKYQGVSDLPELNKISEILEGIAQDISKEFGHSLKARPVVLLYDVEQFQEILKLPHWISGLYDGKIRVPAYQIGMEDQLLRSIVAHELTHAFISEISSGKAPPWINEGLAELIERNYFDEGSLVFDAAVRTGDVLALDYLMTETLPDKKGDPLRASLFYDQSFQITRYLKERGGMFQLKEMLHRFKDGKNSEDALSETFGLTISDLEKEWKTSFSKK